MFDGENWIELTEEQKEEALEKIKKWLLKGCHTGSQTSNAIQRMHSWRLPENCGYFERVTVSGLVAGQDYPSELRWVRQYIANHI